MSPTKVDHTNTVCSICESKSTGKNYDGNPHWIRHKDKNGNWDKKSYICIRCYDDIRKHSVEKRLTKKKLVEKRRCCICGSKDTRIYDGYYCWHNHNCNKQDCTKWLCHTCYTRERQRLPDSQNNTMKSIRNIRTGNLDKEDEFAKGILVERAIVKERKLKNMNIEMDNFSFKFDTSPDTELGIIQIKSETLDMVERRWTFSIDIEQQFDSILLACLDEKRYNIDIVCIIPREYAIKRSGITVLKDQLREGWYNDFKVDPKPYNDAYHSLMEFLENKRYFGIKDLKKWLEKE